MLLAFSFFEKCSAMGCVVDGEVVWLLYMCDVHLTALLASWCNM